MTSATTSEPKATTTEVRGEVLSVLRDLLGGGHTDEVIALVEKLVSRNQQLELLVARMRDTRNRGEHISTDQLDLFLEQLREHQGGELAQASQNLEAAAKEHAGRPELARPPRQPPVRRPPPENLRRIENPIPVPAEERPCPRCGAERKCIGHETTEVIDLIPAEVVVRLDRREVIACGNCDANLVRAPMGDKVVEGGAYGSRLVADLVVGKYRDALPLNRQHEILERLGLSMPSSSMSDQITWATDLMRPLWHRMQAEVLGSKVMHLDGTSLQVRDSDSPAGIVTGALWGSVGADHGAPRQGDVAVYLYTSTAKGHGQRPGEIGPKEFLALRRGYVVADAANLYDTLFQGDARTEVGCNMHARRYFVKALEAGDERAAVPLTAFQTLYDVEDAARAMSVADRRAERQARSRPVYDELVRWCFAYQSLEPPKSSLGAAIQYLLNHRTALTRFLDDGILPIDNGIVERLHRRPAIGRRNYLFAGSHAGAERAAIAYSILGTCALLDINPVEYLADVLPKLARETFTRAAIAALLPAAWKARRAPAAQTQAA